MSANSSRVAVAHNVEGIIAHQLLIMRLYSYARGSYLLCYCR